MAKRILIADDHESVLRGIRVMLESHGDWAVCGDAVNGADAITKAVQLQPDLIILDFAMPVLDGMQAASEISKLLPGVPIVLHTMYGSEVALEAKKHGVARVVEKAKSGALISTVEELLGPPATQSVDTALPSDAIPSLPAVDSGDRHTPQKSKLARPFRVPFYGLRIPNEPKKRVYKAKFPGRCSDRGTGFEDREDHRTPCASATRHQLLPVDAIGRIGHPRP